ncbi:MAG: biotin attachment protein [Deltaproteobacteria bacterium]|nr:biotin attachment protein [Deltaproteobacteria bacterium]
MRKKVKFMCTAFRDGLQSAYGARAYTEDFMPAVEAARDAGIRYFEAGGGARFQSLYFYCNEDAFAMMDRFREVAGPDAELQTLARGVNVVGLESASSEIVKLHAELFKKHGITTIRNFDALNDINNLDYSGKCIAEAGLKHQICVTLMELPPGCTGSHTPEYYESVLQQILDSDIPFDSICFKDASGTAAPSKVYKTIKRARKMVSADTTLHFHTHQTAGTGVSAYIAALEAGVDLIDLSLAPCSGGTCQPDVLVMWHALRGSEYELDVDIEKVREASEVFKDCMQDYFLPPEALAVEPLIPWSPMPGGALTANTQMLRDNGIMDKYPDMIKAMSECVRKGGFGSSVTPVSQFYFQQAFNNVMFGPWEKIAEPYGKMVLGYFGKTPVPPDPEVMKIASEQLNLNPTTRPPLEINDKDETKSIKHAVEILRKEGLEETQENIFIIATCKEKGIKFLKGDGEIGVRKVDNEQEHALGDMADHGDFVITVDGTDHLMSLEDDKVTVNGKVFDVGIRKDEHGPHTPAAAEAAQAEGVAVNAQMPGVVWKILKKAGDSVDEGESILILEAMKMEVPVAAPKAGTLTAIEVSEGEHITNGQELAKIN